MVSINDLSPPSNSLKTSDLEGTEATLTIAGYTIKEFEETDNKTGGSYFVKKPILTFAGTDKTWAANKTNRTQIALAYGDEMDNWIGKTIILYPTKVSFGDKMVEATRVRTPVAPGGKPKFLQKDTHPNAPDDDDMSMEVPF